MATLAASGDVAPFVGLASIFVGGFALAYWAVNRWF